MEIRFIYIDFPFWRAEIGRIALHIGGVDFEDLRISRDEFLRAKENGKLDDGTIVPHRQIPFLTVDGKSIAQTGGISRFCGKLSGLYPADDPVGSALVDQVIDMATDITVLLGPSNAEEDEEKKKQMRLSLAQGALPKKISCLEEQLERDDQEWFAGPHMTIADIAAWRLFGWLTSGVINHIPTELLSPFPNLRRVCRKVEEHPKVSEWVGLTYPKDYPPGNF
ncbi:MAG: glutathione S-transferase [Alphaproteobacteria bacterium]|nr:glutathione S-transferase [Alphaproteobacteria bacterium]MDE0963486.1 glutathione S-transferase [Candidatus Latescibacterota bacterium]